MIHQSRQSFQSQTIFIFLVLLGIVGCHPTENPGVVAVSEPPRSDRGILVNGNDWFQSVVLMVRGEPFCSGVIIDSHTILTAAHCFIDETNELKYDLHKVRVYFGSFGDEGSRGYSIGINRLSIHPDYDPAIKKNDLAKLHFNQNIPINEADLGKNLFPQIVTIDNIHQILGEEDPTIFLVGTGSKNPQGDPPDRKREVHGTLGMLADSGRFLIPTHQGYTCPGDSGCPALVKGRDQKLYLIGILAGGYSFENSQKLGFNSPVSTVTPFDDDCWVKTPNAVPKPICKAPLANSWAARGKPLVKDSDSIRCALVPNPKGVGPVLRASSNICVTPLRKVRTQLMLRETRPRPICN